MEIKIKTVENIFKVAFAVLLVFAAYLIIVGTNRILHGESDPFKGSMHGLYENYLTAIVLVGIGIATGIGFLILTGAKAK